MPDTQPLNDSLQHFGVLGMKWGIRKSPEQLDRKTAKMHKKMEKADSKYLRDGKEFTRAFFKAHNYGIEEMNNYIREKGGIDPNNKKQMAAKTLGIGVSPSGRYSLQFVVSAEGQPSWKIIDQK